ncbi:hypothetical protein IJI69_01730 [Candidatus Saccharibacteria bacterium]|nr:hypothetical protein [Candidatus Saccharibacteria bacterium]
MFFDDLNAIPSLSQKSGFSIFVMKSFPAFIAKEDANHLVIKPDDSSQIKIEQVREIIDRTKAKQTSDFFIHIIKAEAMNEKAENAFLKLLEEPSENYHFVMFVNSASSLLPTILSRGDLYIQRIKDPLNQPINAEETIKKYAKRIISAKDNDLPGLVNEIVNDKEGKKNTREFALQICETAIEILYKSYFATENIAFTKKLPKLINAYENLKQNGHIKLHLVADLC